MKTTSNGIPYDAARTQNAVILYPSKELHKLPAVMAAKKELKSAGFKTFITWTRAVIKAMPMSERIGKQ